MCVGAELLVVVSGSVLDVSGVNAMQTVQNQQCYSHASCHEERAVLLLSPE